MKFAVLIPCGPSPLEPGRIKDLLDAISHHEPECALVLILDDSGGSGLEEFKGVHDQIPVEIFKNPRAGEGWGWAGGLVHGELSALAFLAQRMPDLDFVVKMDTDALVVAPFSSELARLFEDRTIGMVGSHITDATDMSEKQTPPVSYFRRKTRKLMAPVSLWRKPAWQFRNTLFDAGARRVRNILCSAISKGYQPGELIEGGSLAWSGGFIKALAGTDLPSDRKALMGLAVSDDVFLTPLVYFFGLKCVDSPLFSIEPTMLRYDLERMLLLEKGAAIIHSVKGSSTDYEEKVRAAFREKRTAEALQSSLE